MIQNVIKATNEDARISLEIQELKELTFSLDVFTLPEIIKDIFNAIALTKKNAL